MAGRKIENSGTQTSKKGTNANQSEREREIQLATRRAMTTAGQLSPRGPLQRGHTRQLRCRARSSGPAKSGMPWPTQGPPPTRAGGAVAAPEGGGSAKPTAANEGEPLMRAHQAELGGRSMRGVGSTTDLPPAHPLRRGEVRRGQLSLRIAARDSPAAPANVGQAAGLGPRHGAVARLPLGAWPANAPPSPSCARSVGSTPLAPPSPRPPHEAAAGPARATGGGGRAGEAHHCHRPQPHRTRGAREGRGEKAQTKITGRRRCC